MRAPAASLQGYVIAGDQLVPLAGLEPSLGLASVTGPTEFVSTPGEVGFSPDGRQLIVTTKSNGNDIDVYAARAERRAVRDSGSSTASRERCRSASSSTRSAGWRSPRLEPTPSRPSG